MRAAVYARMSTDKQSAEPKGLPFTIRRPILVVLPFLWLASGPAFAEEAGSIQKCFALRMAVCQDYFMTGIQAAETGREEVRVSPKFSDKDRKHELGQRDSEIAVLVDLLRSCRHSALRSCFDNETTAP